MLEKLQKHSFVPRAGIEPARAFRPKGFSYHYSFHYQDGRPHLFGVWTIPSPWISIFRCVVSSLCTFLLWEAWLKITIGVTR